MQREEKNKLYPPLRQIRRVVRELDDEVKKWLLPYFGIRDYDTHFVECYYNENVVLLPYQR
jgi:hypothetical protein